MERRGLLQGWLGGKRSRRRRLAGQVQLTGRLSPGRAGRACAALATAVLAAGACSPPPPNETGYVERLLEDRALKDEFFAAGPDSPVPLDRRSWMLPIRYYEPDLAYRVPAQLTVPDEQPVFQVPTSTGQVRAMQRVGTLEFMLNGEPRTLAALVELPVQEVTRLFVPFRDETTGTETYPAGRYLDLNRTPTGIYDLDFNRRVPSDLLLRRGLRLPLPAPRESSRHPGARRRAAAPGGRAAVPRRGRPGPREPGCRRWRTVTGGPRCGGSSSTSTASSPTPSGCTWAPTRRCWPARA